MNSAIVYIAPQLSDEMSHFYIDYLAIYRQSKLDLKTIVFENGRANCRHIMRVFFLLFFFFRTGKLHKYKRGTNVKRVFPRIAEINKSEPCSSRTLETS